MTNQPGKRAAVVFVSEETDKTTKNHSIFSAGALCMLKTKFIDRVLWKTYNNPVIFMEVEGSKFKQIVNDFRVMDFLKAHKPIFLFDGVILILPTTMPKIHDIFTFFNLKFKNEKKKSKHKKRKTIHKATKNNVV